MEFDPKYMRRALQLASCGRYNVSPNPMVGAVIVNHDGVIVGEGFHRRCGEGHAEVNAVASVKDCSILPDCVMYVTLEPCSHFGKTPPCARLIIESGIKKVVVGCLDPFEKVRGRGVQMLRDAGVEVEVGVMRHECEKLNVRFMTAHRLCRPYVVLKWAQSCDGFLDYERDLNEPAMKISTPVTSMLVHRLRAECDAIIVGKNTFIADRPKLNTRLWYGHSPRVVVLDRCGNMANIALKYNNPLYLAPNVDVTTAKKVDWIPVEENESIDSWLGKLYKHGVTSLLVEGGAKLLNSFVECGTWDEARIEISSSILGRHGRAKAPQLNLRPRLSIEIDGNKIEIYCNNSDTTASQLCEF